MDVSPSQKAQANIHYTLPYCCFMQLKYNTALRNLGEPCSLFHDAGKQFFFIVSDQDLETSNSNCSKVLKKFIYMQENLDNLRWRDRDMTFSLNFSKICTNGNQYYYIPNVSL